ncbi:MAG: VWA domain-containing protein [Bacteroidota bacterium]
MDDRYCGIINKYYPMSVAIRSILAGSCLLFCLNLLSAQSTPPPIQFIFDGSGSMWGDLEGSTKIEIAKAAIAEISQEFSADQALGLIAYGHRRERDCTDIEALLPITNTDQEQFLAAVRAIQPKGRTPLAQSVTLALEQLRSQGEAATLILFTDGIETCSGDLCALVEQAKAEGIEFVLHIVGFDLGEANRQPLQCAANAAGGLYLDVADAAGLQAALSRTTQLTVDEGEASLAVRVTKDGELRDAVIKVYPAASKEDISRARTYTSDQTNPAYFNLAAASYDLEVWLVGERGIPHQWRRDVIISGGDTTEVELDFSTGSMSILVQENGALHDAKITVTPVGAERAVYSSRSYTGERSNPHLVDLLPGRYRVELSSIRIEGRDNEFVFEEVIVAPQETTEIGHEFASGILLIGSRKDGELVDAVVSVRDATGRVDQGRTYAHADSNPRSFRLSPGTYEVLLRGLRLADDPERTLTVTVEAGQTTERTVDW